jgi:hypothetical protein
MAGRMRADPFCEVVAELVLAQLLDAVCVGVSGERVGRGELDPGRQVTRCGGEPDRDDVIEQAVARVVGYDQPWREAVAEIAAIDLASLRAGGHVSVSRSCRARQRARSTAASSADSYG